MYENETLQTEQSQKSKISFKTAKTNKTNLTHFTNNTKKTNLNKSQVKDNNRSVLNKSGYEADLNKTSNSINLGKKLEFKNQENESLTEIVSQFLLVIDKGDSSKLQIVLLKLVKYAEEALSKNFSLGLEFTNNDEDSEAFEKFINYSKIALNNTKDFGNLLKDVLILFSLVYNGKWAEYCFSLIIDLIQVQNDPVLHENVQKRIISNIKTYLNKSYLTDYPFIINALEQFIDYDYQELLEFVYFKISEEMLSKPINFKLLQKTLIKLHVEEGNQNLLKNCFYIISMLKTLEFVKKLFKNKHTLNKLLNKNIITLENIQNLSSIFSFAISHYSVDDENYSNTYYQELLQSSSTIVLILLEFVNYKPIIPLIKRKNSKSNVDEIHKSEERRKLVMLISEGIKEISKIVVNDKEMNQSKHTLTTEETQISKSFNPFKVFLGNKINEKTKKNEKTNNFDKSELCEFLLNFIIVYINTNKHVLLKGESLIPADKINFKLTENTNVCILIKVMLNLMCYDITKFYENQKEFMSLFLQLSKPIENEFPAISMIIDPLLYETFIYCLILILTNYDKFFLDGEYNFDYNLLFVFMKNIKEKLFFSLQLLNQDGKEYHNLLKYSEIYIRKEVQQINLDFSFECLTNKFVLDLFCKIIEFLIIMGQFATKQQSEKVKDLFNTYNGYLNDQNRDTYLIKSLEINSDDVKCRVLEVFLHVNPTEISTVEVKGIINTIERSNIVEMKLERLVGSLFIFILRKFDDSLNNNDTLPFENQNVVPLAMKILEKNIVRTDIENVKTKNDIEFLNVCILVLLINLSVYPNFQNVFEGQDYKKTLCNVFYSIAQYNKVINDYVPLCLEKCIIGWSIDNLKEIISNETIYPYSLTSLRIFSHIADILCNEEFEWVGVIYDPNKSLDEIINDVKLKLQQYELDMITQESSIWHTMMIITNNNNKKENNDNEKDARTVKLSKQQHKTQIKTFCKNIKFFLEWLLGQITFGKSDVFVKYNTVKFDPNLKKLKNKYSNSKSNEFSNFQILNRLLNEGTSSEDILDRTASDYIEFVLKAINLENDDKQNPDIVVGENYTKDDLSNFNFYGSRLENLKRIPAEETIDNPYLRSLVMSSFLRCVFSVSLYGEEADKDLLKKELRMTDNFLKFCMMIDTTNYIYCCIPNKILYVFEFIFNKISLDIKESEKLNEVESLINISSLVISKIFANSSQLLTQTNSKDLIQNLVNCCLTITREIEYMPFDQKVKELLTERVMNKKIIHLLIDTLVTVAIEENKILSLKKTNKLDKKDKVKNKKEQNSNHTTSTYNLINFDVPNLLITYMGIKSEFAYYILELLNKFIFLKQVNIRKSLLNDILENYKMQNFKKKLLSTYEIYFINKCELIDYKEGFHDQVFLFITDSEILCTKYSEKYMSEGGIDLKDVKIIDNIRYSLVEVKHLLLMELGNRIFIKIKNSYISLFFKKYIQALEFKKVLTHKCKQISIYKSEFKYWLKNESPKIKTSEDELEKSNADNNQELMESFDGNLTRNSVFTHNNVKTVTNLNNTKNDKNEKKDVKTTEKQKDNNILKDFFSSYQSNLYILGFEVKSFINFDSFLTKKSNKIIPNFKIALLSEFNYNEINTKYEELQNGIQSSNLESDNLHLILFNEDVTNLKDEDFNKNVREGDFTKIKQCYTYFAEYNLNEMTSINFEGKQNIVINFAYGTSVKLTFFGDWGYYNFNLRLNDYINKHYKIK